MRKLLIADSSEALCMVLTDALQNTYQIRTCQDGITALELLRIYEPDVLILDLLLPRLDGITLLQMAQQNERVPLTLATTLLVNDYVMESIDKYHVGYMMVKPCDTKALIMRVNDLAERLTDQSISYSDPKSRANDFLMELAVPTKLKGYGYIREAMFLMRNDFAQSITKELYPAVATAFGVSATQVERSIRNAIEISWKKRNRTIWKRYFDDADDDAAKPTNAEFVSRLAHCLEEDLF